MTVHTTPWDVTATLANLSTTKCLDLTFVILISVNVCIASRKGLDFISLTIVNWNFSLENFQNGDMIYFFCQFQSDHNCCKIS